MRSGSVVLVQSPLDQAGSQPGMVCSSGCTAESRLKRPVNQQHPQAPRQAQRAAKWVGWGFLPQKPCRRRSVGQSAEALTSPDPGRSPSPTPLTKT